MADQWPKGYEMYPKRGFVSQIPFKEFFVEMEISKCFILNFSTHIFSLKPETPPF